MLVFVFNYVTQFNVNENKLWRFRALFVKTGQQITPYQIIICFIFFSFKRKIIVIIQIVSYSNIRLVNYQCHSGFVLFLYILDTPLNFLVQMLSQRFQRLLSVACLNDYFIDMMQYFLLYEKMEKCNKKQRIVPTECYSHRMLCE